MTYVVDTSRHTKKRNKLAGLAAQTTPRFKPSKTPHSHRLLGQYRECFVLAHEFLFQPGNVLEETLTRQL